MRWRNSRRERHYVRLLDHAEDSVLRLSRVWSIRESELMLHYHIAEGGFGEVWFGEYHGHAVAVKRLRNDVTLRGLMDFEREIELMCTLRHEHIVFFYGAGIDHLEVTHT